MMEHTKEPWRMEYSLLIGGGKDETNSIVIGKIDNFADGLVGPANARRIVACVNFCNGIETEKLEEETELPGIGLFGKVAARLTIENKNLTSQRDELLAALKEAAQFIEDCGAQAGVSALLDNKIYPLVKKYDHA